MGTSAVNSGIVTTLVPLAPRTGKVDKLRVAHEDVLDRQRVRELSAGVLEADDDLGAAHAAHRLADLERPIAHARPAVGRHPRGGRLREDFEAIAHHDCTREAGGGSRRQRQRAPPQPPRLTRAVEPHAELPDDGRADVARALALRLEPLEEGLGAAARDRAEVLDELGLAHADARVGDGDRVCRLVGGDANLERRL